MFNAQIFNIITYFFCSLRIFIYKIIIFKSEINNYSFHYVFGLQLVSNMFVFLLKKKYIRISKTDEKHSVNLYLQL